MKIGRLAARTGLGVDTIRYYERMGLLEAERRPSGYRIFDEAAVDRVRLIKDLQQLGLTLDEIGGVLRAAMTPSRTCTTETSRLETALERTDAKIAMLTAARERLGAALQRCRAGDCDLLDRARASANGEHTRCSPSRLASPPARRRR